MVGNDVQLKGYLKKGSRDRGCTLISLIKEKMSPFKDTDCLHLVRQMTPYAFFF